MADELTWYPEQDWTLDAEYNARAFESEGDVKT